MSKRGYKLQEFVAHAGNVNCLSIGKKNCRVFLTGGDDQKVNLWSIGKATPLVNFCGHTSPVESVAFDSAEILVVGGSSSGSIKLWDLEETKTVRTLTGHRSYCTALEFHPFGDIFASGSMDTNLKIWDIKKKGCIHTYKGHARGISTIRFTPDGRWVISGGFDNVVKVWDLTAGKLLHDFKFHEGHIRSIDFHPLEFLMATGSADKTVKFWDLETFEMIGSAKREATGVRSITFHPDGRTLFCGLDDGLKVYSWEPVICHDSVDMGWSMLGDICIYDGKLLGGAHYENSVAVWASDISLIQPYGERMSEQHGHLEQKCSNGENALEKEEGNIKSKSSLRSTVPDVEPKEIKNIYVDSVNTVSSKTVRSLDSSNVVVSSDSTEISTVGIKKQGSAVRLPAKSNVAANNINFVVPSIVPRDSADAKDLVSSRRESSINGSAAKPPQSRRLSNARFDMERMSVSLESAATMNRSPVGSEKDKLIADDNAKESSVEKQSSIKTVAEKSDKTPLVAPSSPGNCEEPLNPSKGGTGIKYINGVAVRHGRTRSLVERFERREMLYGSEILTSDMSHSTTAEPVETPTSQNGNPHNITREEPVVNDEPCLDDKPSVKNRPAFNDKASVSNKASVNDKASLTNWPSVSDRPSFLKDKPSMNDKPSLLKDKPSVNYKPHVKDKPSLSDKPSVEDKPPVNDMSSVNDTPSGSDNIVIENLMQNHDIALSTYRSRLTKLQVVRHFWERNDVKGAINAVRKLPDHSVQADVVSVLIEKMEIITLDLFSCLLPVLVGLLESKIEKHVSVSLELLLKLVAVFGTVVRSAVTAPPAVGVDLHAEERRKCCRQCFTHLQNMQRTLPELVRRGGVVAKCAQELNLVLQQT